MNFDGDIQKQIEEISKKVANGEELTQEEIEFEQQLVELVQKT